MGIFGASRWEAGTPFCWRGIRIPKWSSGDSSHFEKKERERERREKEGQPVPGCNSEFQFTPCLGWWEEAALDRF